MKNKEKGIALITALALGIIALSIIGALLYFITKGTNISGVKKRYYTANEAAKGAAEQVIKLIIQVNENGKELECNGGNICSPCPISINSSCKIDLSINKLGDYNIEAYLLGKETKPTFKLYTIRVKAYKNNSPEKSEIEFVYKVE